MIKKNSLKYIKSIVYSTIAKKKLSTINKIKNIKKINYTIKLKNQNYKFFCILNKHISIYNYLLIKQNKINPNYIYIQ